MRSTRFSEVHHSFCLHTLYSGLKKLFSKAGADPVLTLGEEMSLKEACKSCKESKADQRLRTISGEKWHFCRRKERKLGKPRCWTCSGQVGTE